MPSIVTIRVGSRAIVAKREGKHFTKDKFVLKTWKSILRRRKQKVGRSITPRKYTFDGATLIEAIPEYSTRIPSTPPVVPDGDALSFTSKLRLASQGLGGFVRTARGGVICNPVQCPPDCWLCAKRAFLYID